MDIGAPELIIVLVIVLLVFGVGRVANLGGELGKAIHAFRSALQPDEKDAQAGQPEGASSVAAGLAPAVPPAAAEPEKPEPASAARDGQA